MYTHLKLCLATATHNFMWVKITYIIMYKSNQNIGQSIKFYVYLPLQVENCDSNSRLVVDEDDNGKLRPER